MSNDLPKNAVINTKQHPWAWGRPVDVLVTPDDALLLSYNRASEIYRIVYKK